jgi:hypothetical protein
MVIKIAFLLSLLAACTSSDRRTTDLGQGASPDAAPAASPDAMTAPADAAVPYLALVAGEDAVEMFPSTSRGLSFSLHSYNGFEGQVPVQATFDPQHVDGQPDDREDWKVRIDGTSGAGEPLIVDLHADQVVDLHVFVTSQPVPPLPGSALHVTAPGAEAHTLITVSGNDPNVCTDDCGNGLVFLCATGHNVYDNPHTICIDPADSEAYTIGAFGYCGVCAPQPLCPEECGEGTRAGQVVCTNAYDDATTVCRNGPLTDGEYCGACMPPQ